jgi:hypothetical protein
MKSYEFPKLPSQRTRVADLWAAIRVGPARIGARIGIHGLRHVKPSDFLYKLTPRRRIQRDRVAEEI